MKTALILVILTSFASAAPALSAVKPADYRAMVIALHDQDSANTGLLKGLAGCLVVTFSHKPSSCIDAPQKRWTDALQITTVMLRDVALDNPGASCNTVLHAFVKETNASINGIKAYATAARAGKLTASHLPGYDRVRAAALSEMPARLTTACHP